MEIDRRHAADRRAVVRELDRQRRQTVQECVAWYAAARAGNRPMGDRG